MWHIAAATTQLDGLKQERMRHGVGQVVLTFAHVPEIEMRVTRVSEYRLTRQSKGGEAPEPRLRVLNSRLKVVELHMQHNVEAHQIGNTVLEIGIPVFHLGFA